MQLKKWVKIPNDSKKCKSYKLLFIGIYNNTH